jgi:hypothetical protein
MHRFNGRDLGGGTHRRGSQLTKAPIFLLDVLHLERGRRYPLFEQALLKCLSDGIGVGLERQLQIGRPFRRDDGDPPVLPDRKIVLRHETEHACVEREGLVLIVDQNARQLDSHVRESRRHTAVSASRKLRKLVPSASDSPGRVPEAWCRAPRSENEPVAGRPTGARRRVARTNR